MTTNTNTNGINNDIFTLGENTAAPQPAAPVADDTTEQRERYFAFFQLGAVPAAEAAPVQAKPAMPAPALELGSVPTAAPEAKKEEAKAEPALQVATGETNTKEEAAAMQPVATATPARRMPAMPAQSAYAPAGTADEGWWKTVFIRGDSREVLETVQMCDQNGRLLQLHVMKDTLRKRPTTGLPRVSTKGVSFITACAVLLSTLALGHSQIANADTLQGAAASTYVAEITTEQTVTAVDEPQDIYLGSSQVARLAPGTQLVLRPGAPAELKQGEMWLLGMGGTQVLQGVHTPHGTLLPGLQGNVGLRLEGTVLVVTTGEGRARMQLELPSGNAESELRRLVTVPPFTQITIDTRRLAREMATVYTSRLDRELRSTSVLGYARPAPEGDSQFIRANIALDRQLLQKAETEAIARVRARYATAQSIAGQTAGVLDGLVVLEEKKQQRAARDVLQPLATALGAAEKGIAAESEAALADFHGRYAAARATDATVAELVRTNALSQLADMRFALPGDTTYPTVLALRSILQVENAALDDMDTIYLLLTRRGNSTETVRQLQAQQERLMTGMADATASEQRLRLQQQRNMLVSLLRLQWGSASLLGNDTLYSLLLAVDRAEGRLVPAEEASDYSIERATQLVGLLEQLAADSRYRKQFRLMEQQLQTIDWTSMPTTIASMLQQRAAAASTAAVERTDSAVAQARGLTAADDLSYLLSLSTKAPREVAAEVVKSFAQHGFIVEEKNVSVSTDNATATVQDVRLKQMQNSEGKAVPVLAGTYALAAEELRGTQLAYGSATRTLGTVQLKLLGNTLTYELAKIATEQATAAKEAEAIDPAVAQVQRTNRLYLASVLRTYGVQAREADISFIGAQTRSYRVDNATVELEEGKTTSVTAKFTATIDGNSITLTDVHIQQGAGASMALQPTALAGLRAAAADAMAELQRRAATVQAAQVELRQQGVSAMLEWNDNGLLNATNAYMDKDGVRTPLQLTYDPARKVVTSMSSTGTPAKSWNNVPLTGLGAALIR